ncbi:MAG: DUF6122 family protein [Gemmatimonadota bacterium]|nr:DUF6122 family protein [Gemmatimonadota bacterium]
MSWRAPIHLGLHLAVPWVAARWLGGPAWRRAFLLLLSGWLIDVDHLLATPIYDAGRCSLGFHPLHTVPAAVGYALLLFPVPTRLIGAGLLLHLGLDGLDCAWMASIP